MNPATPEAPSWFRGLRRLTWAAAAFSLASATYAAWWQGWTYDEPVHLLWTRRLLDTGVSERDSHSRFNSRTPLPVLNVLAEKAALAAGIQDEAARRFVTRLPTVGWLAALLAATLVLGRRWFGTEAGHLATIAVALDPNLVAHASLVTVDVGYALATLLASAAAIRFARRPSAASGAVLGATIGFAFATKFSAFLLVAGLLLLPLARERRTRAWSWQGVRRVTVGLAAALAAAATVVCAAYLFHEVGRPLSEPTWTTRPFQIAARAVPGLRLPLPAGFLTGLDRARSTERDDWNIYLLGRRHPHGVGYFFAFLWLVKTPLFLLAVQVAGLARGVLSRVLLTEATARYLGATLLVTLAYFSFAFHTQLGYRFVLMCVPIAWLLAARSLAGLLARPAARVVGLGAVAVAVVENALYLGNPLAFTNAAVWPKTAVYRLMADSNVDWGQNRERIRDRLAAAGVPQSHLDPVHILPGHNTISLNVLAGLWDLEQHRWLREHARPAGHFDHTYLWYDVGDDVYEQFVNERRRRWPSPADAVVCGEPPAEQTPPGEQIPFRVEGVPDLNRIWIVCVATRRGADFGLRSLASRLRLGPYRPGEPCAGELVDEGQVVWHRLEAGVHAFCAAEVPHRRAWLAHAYDGRWLVRRRGASVTVREVHVEQAAPPSEDESARSR
jgi:4-amino-4-deoxy-L-arabinose transferase-like glycosyltransferase